MVKDKCIYRVSFIVQDKVYEIYCKKVIESGVFGFIQIEDLIFDENSTIVVDTAEERLKQEYADVKRTHVPMHAILRIDEVMQKGECKIIDLPKDKSNIAPFPGTVYRAKDPKLS